MQRIGMLTIGQSPREDILEGMRPYLTHAVEIVQRGALDDLDDATLAALRPEPGGSVLVTRLRDGTEVQVSHEKLVPLLREGVNHLQECGVAFIVALCTGELTGLQSDVLIVYPSRLLQGVVTGLAQGRKLGVVLPAADQIPEAEASREVLWPGMEVFFTWASPYVDASMRQRRWERAARDLEQAAVDLVVLDCMGMDEGMKRTIQEIVHRPVVLPRMVVAQVADLML